jgi:hypothetical protein
MRFKDLNGRERYLNIEKSRIRWDDSSVSKFQFEVKQFLKYYWSHHVVYEEMPLLGTRLRLDFYNANKKIAIECNGRQHGTYNKFFHKGNRYNYFYQIKRDSKKFFWCEKNGITLIEIEPEDLPLTENFFKSLGVLL